MQGNATGAPLNRLLVTDIINLLSSHQCVLTQLAQISVRISVPHLSQLKYKVMRYNGKNIAARNGESSITHIRSISVDRFEVIAPDLSRHTLKEWS